MPDEASITRWLTQYQAGDRAALQPLWEAFFPRLVQLARAQLQGRPRRAADEEDVALSAFTSFCKGVEAGRFPDLDDRHDLWRLLVKIAVCKARHLVRDERAQKRGGGQVRGDSAFGLPEGSDEAQHGIEQVVGREPPPELAAQVADECTRLLGRLDTQELRDIAVWKMEGFTSEEIGVRLGCARLTVERRLRLIRQIWEEEPAA